LKSSLDWTFTYKGLNTLKIRREVNRNPRYSILGEFICRGLDTFGPLKLIGGVNKRRPNEADLEAARKFAKGLQEKLRSGG